VSAIIRQIAATTVKSCGTEKKSWPMLYVLTPIRSNVS